jgi:hypothetical protein
MTAAALAAAVAVPSAVGQPAGGPRIVSSPALGADPGRESAWAAFFQGLPHGPEIGSLTVLLGTEDDVRARCGEDAGGCYLPLTRQITMLGGSRPGLGEDDEIARHEYGHHLAEQSDNAPFAPGLGTKRWFTQEHVCARLRSGELVDDAALGYERSVAEGFAEAYRIASGGDRHQWIVDPALYPAGAARRAILADVRHPWTGPHVRGLRGRLAAGGSATVTIRAPLDGDLAVTASAARPRLRLRLRLADQAGRPLARGRGSLHYRDCGSRRLRLTVAGPAPRARFRLTVSTP